MILAIAGGILLALIAVKLLRLWREIVVILFILYLIGSASG
jgi:hypothetical protein